MGSFPNKEAQFKKGNPGGPGVPKGTRHLSTVIQELMDDDNFELKLKDGSVLKGRPSKHLTRVMYALAVSGNTKAAEWIAKHGYGIKQVHEFADPVKEVLAKFDISFNEEALEQDDSNETPA
jgi:hypothetical protein